MPDKQLKLGFIGGGLASAVGPVHFAASQLDGIWKLEAGAFSRNHDTNLKTAGAWNVALDRTYDDWREMLEHEKGRLDAIAVLLPTPMHTEAVNALLEYNIPIICEKSLTTSVEELSSIKERYDANKHFLAVTYNYSGYHQVRELRRLIEAGELGQISQLQFEMPQEGFIRPPDIAGKAAPPQSWRMTDHFIPMISFDLGMHLHQMSGFLLNQEPSEVMCNYQTMLDSISVIDTANLWLKYPDGAQASFWYTKGAIGHRNGMRIRIYGSKASCEWYQMNPEELRISYLDGKTCILDRSMAGSIGRGQMYNRMKPGHPSGFIEAFANHYSDIGQKLHQFKEGKDLPNPYVCGLGTAEKGIQFFQAASISSQTKQWQQVSEITS